MTGAYILIDNMKETKNALSEREREQGWTSRWRERYKALRQKLTYLPKVRDKGRHG